MAKQKGSNKLRRSAKKKPYYAGQKVRTTKNKLRRKARIERRKKENPNPKHRNQKRLEQRAARKSTRADKPSQ